MSFDLAPADLVLKIFHQLPFKDRVHLSGVNRLFRCASKESIAKMKSLIIDDDLTAYLIWGENFSTLLESCSPNLKSIDASHPSCNKWMLSALAQFVYPKLENIKIMIRCEKLDINPQNEPYQVKKLISRCPNLRSCILNLYCKFDWPDNMVFDKMEKLEIQVPYDWHDRDIVHLSPTLRPLIGKVPNLKYLTIGSDFPGSGSGFVLSAREFTELLASTPYLEELQLELPRNTEVNISQNFVDAIPYWRLPKLTTLQVGFNSECPNQSAILRYLPAVCPRLVSFKSDTIEQIDDRDLVGLSRLKHLYELRLTGMRMKENQIVDVVNSIPSMSVLEIGGISEVDEDTPQTFIEFLKSSAASISEVTIEVSLLLYESEHLEDVLEEIENNGGPFVSYDRDEEYYLNPLCIWWIHYG